MIQKSNYNQISGSSWKTEYSTHALMAEKHRIAGKTLAEYFIPVQNYQPFRVSAKTVLSCE